MAINTFIALTGGAAASLGQNDTSAKMTVNVNFCNRNATPVLVSLAICSTTTPGVAEWIEYEIYLQGSGDPLNANSMERGGIAVAPGKYVVALSDTSNVNAAAYGF